MLRRWIAAVVPGLGLIAVAALLPPVETGYLALLFFAGALLLAVAGAFLVRPEGSEPDTADTIGWRIGLLLVGAGATAFYWYRIWSHDAWDISPIPMKPLYIAGFWWPGVLLASLAWALVGTQIERTYRRYFMVLALGLAAGVLGAGAYHATHVAYLRTTDGMPLERAIERIATRIPGSVDWSNRHGVVSLTANCDWAADAPPYTVYACLEHVARGVETLLSRSDVEEISVQTWVGDVMLFAGDASDASPGGVAQWMQELDRNILKDKGRLDMGSLDEMVWGETPAFTKVENSEVFEKAFTYALNGDEVSMVFAPDGPLTVDNIDVYAAAYRAANDIIRHTTAYFPEIARFQVDLAGERRTVERREAEATPFLLQARLAPEDQVLGLVAGDTVSGETELDPVTFNPPTSVDGSQVAAIVGKGKKAVHESACLFEEIPLHPGRLYVTQAGPDGTATVFVIAESGMAAGPVDIPPGTQSPVGDRWVTNLGLIARSEFAAPTPAEG